LAKRQNPRESDVLFDHAVLRIGHGETLQGYSKLGRVAFLVFGTFGSFGMGGAGLVSFGLKIVLVVLKHGALKVEYAYRDEYAHKLELIRDSKFIKSCRS
jgi:hypothetical protein